VPVGTGSCAVPVREGSCAVPAAAPVGTGGFVAPATILSAFLVAKRQARRARAIRRQRRMYTSVLIAEYYLSLGPEDVKAHSRACFATAEEDNARYWFRFDLADLYRLRDALQLPRTWATTRNRYRTTDEEALLILLSRLAYPSRWSSLYDRRFGRSDAELCEIFYEITAMLERRWWPHVRCWRPAFEPVRARNLARAVARKVGYNSARVLLFLDGVDFHTMRPGGANAMQASMSDSHHWFHATKFLSFMDPSGISTLVFGPFPGGDTDLVMFNEARCEEVLHAVLDPINAALPVGKKLFAYADSIFPLSEVLQVRFPGRKLSAAETAYNYAMAGAREQVDHSYAHIKNHFAFVDWHRKLCVGQSPVGMWLRVVFLIENCHVCLYGSEASSYFGVTSPTLEEYLTPF